MSIPNGIATARTDGFAAVKARSPQALQLLERAVRQNSGTLNVEGVRAAGEIFRAELDALGFSTRWEEMPPAMRRAGHLALDGASRRARELEQEMSTLRTGRSGLTAYDPRARGGKLDISR